MRHKQYAFLFKASAASLFLAASGLTVAQAADTNGDEAATAGMMEEIVVTSRKMGAESLQDIPAAISALDRRSLEEGMVVDFEDFARQVPGLTFQDSAPGEKRYVIRGITSAGQQQVAVYYDEVPLPGVQSSTSNSGSQTTDLKLYDMERVEVLRGPQGTAFGANSQGGTVRFITTQPKLDKWEAYVSGELSQTDPSSDSNWNYQAVMNVPLGETFGLRVLAYDGKDAGYIDNHRCRPTDPAEDPRVPGTQLSCLNLNDLNWAETTGFRTNLLWQASEKATIKGQFWWQKRDTGGDSSYMPFDAFSLNPTDKVYVGQHDVVQKLGFFEEGEFKTGDYAQTPKPDEQWIYALTGEFELPFADMTATASRYERDFNFKFDSTWQIFDLLCPSDNLDATPLECAGRPDLLYALTDQTQRMEQNAFELRLNSNDSGSAIKWVMGGFWRERKSYFHSFVPVINDQGLVYDPGTPFTIPPDNTLGAGIPGCHPCVFAREDNKDIEEYAFFGEVSWSITDALDLNFGARYFDVKQTEAGRTVFQFAAFGGNPPDPTTPDGATPFLVGHLNDNETPWKVALAWHLSDDLSFYGLRASGYRLGGTNNNGIGNIFIPKEFGGDKLVNYEAGIKSRWLDRRVTFNAAVFFMKWDNIQVSGRDLTGAFGFIGNAGTAEVNGVEVEFAAEVTSHFDVTAQFTYLGKHELTEDQKSDVVIASGLKGDKLARVPDFTGSFTAQYHYKLPIEGWNGAFRVEGSYTGDSYTELRPDSPVNRYQDSYSIFNARANFHNDPLDLDVTLFMENIADKHGDVFISTGSGQPTTKVTNRPRTFGIQVTKGFGR